MECKRPYAREMRRFVCAFRLRMYGVRSETLLQAVHDTYTVMYSKQQFIFKKCLGQYSVSSFVTIFFLHKTYVCLSDYSHNYSDGSKESKKRFTSTNHANVVVG